MDKVIGAALISTVSLCYYVFHARAVLSDVQSEFDDSAADDRGQDDVMNLSHLLTLSRSSSINVRKASWNLLLDIASTGKS